MIKIAVDAPKSMIEFAKTQQARDRPYDICLMCPFLRESCDGPNVLAMDYPRWIEWAKERIRQLGITKPQLSERADVPLSTINSALSGTSYDIRSETMRKLTRVLIGGCWGQYPCHLASLLMDGEDLDVDAELEAVQTELEAAHAEITRLTGLLDSTDQRHEKSREDDQRIREYLKEQVNIRDHYLRDKNKTIRFLSIAIIILICFVLGVLTFDALNGDIGFFRY